MANILVIDDNSIARHLNVTTLRRQGHSVLEASNGANGLEIVKSQKPDLVICDMFMPIMDGYDFVRAVRADPAIADTRLILCTATHVDPEVSEFAETNGIRHVLPKPPLPEQVIAAVNAELGLQSVPLTPVEVDVPTPVHDLLWLHARLESATGDLANLLKAVDVRCASYADPELTNLANRYAENLRTVERVSTRLIAIAEASISIMPDHGTDQVLARFFEASQFVVDAPYAATALFGADGQALERVLSRGFDPDVWVRHGARPSAVDSVRKLQKPFRTRSGAAGRQKIDLPVGHPAAVALLAVPIPGRQGPRGWMYFANDTTEFRPDEEHAAMALAAKLGTCLDGAAQSEVIRAQASRLTQEGAEREEALVRLRLRDRALASITQGITITEHLTGSDSRLIYINPAFEHISGYSLDDLRERGLVDLWTDATVPEQVSKAVSAKSTFKVETKLKRKNADPFLDSVSASPIVDESGAVSHYVAVHEDITVARKREEMLIEAQKMETVGQLTGGIAHDFNNILSVIQSNAEDISGYLKNSEYADEAAMIVHAAKRGAELAQQLLAFSRKKELHPQRIEISAALSSASKLLRRAVPENVELTVLCADGLPVVHVDLGMLENSLLNLTVNARDAMPNGGKLTIEASLARLGAGEIRDPDGVKPGDYISIAVSDSGTGMTPETLERAFEPFFTTKEVGKGTGLGLSMVYGFVRQSGGYAAITSKLNHGTTITLYLPPSTAGDQAVQQAAPQAAPSPAAAASAKILLVEDDDLVRASVTSKLRRFGYTVTEVNQAAAALSRLEENAAYDLVFSDVIMPGSLTGADLAKIIGERWPKIKVLLASGYTASAMTGKVTIPPGVTLLTKPYSTSDLKAAISNTLEGAQK